MTLSTKLSLVVTFTFALGAAAAFGGGDKCTIAVKGDSPPAKACAKGGRAEAKKTMKDMVKVAKANGKTFTCENCHKDLETYELTKNAHDDFPKLVAAQTK
jgi:hypothetical protein